MSLCILGHEKTETNLRLMEEAKKHFDKVFYVPIDSIAIGLSDKFSISYRTTELLKFDAILPRISKKLSSYGYQLLSLFPEDKFMPIRPISFLLSTERFFLLTVLRKRGIPTINLHLTKTPKAASAVLEKSKFPVILRTGEKKTGIFVENKQEAVNVIDALGTFKKSILIEEVVKDMVSVYVAEPDIIAAVKKKTKQKDVLFAKGDIKKTKLRAEVEQLALDAAKAVDTQMARIDISLNGSPKVIDIKLNPELIKASKVTGVDLPKKIIESVHNNYQAHKEKPMLVKFFEDAKSVVKDVLKSKQML
ncbi:MAG: hypothetical protein ISS36_01990 [Candidatus Aenigmarchaeota archaeon]|nr:hypothetical protein [Candidatus Aenigmarchaeota archaeon]